MRAMLLLSSAVIFLLLVSPSIQAQDRGQKNPVYEPSFELRRSRSNVVKVIGYSVEGDAIRAFFWGHGKSYVYILAAIHGNEGNSNQLVEQIRELLEKNFSRENKAVTFIMIPCLNPDGMCLNCRTNANNVDLNRNFPLRNLGDQVKLSCYHQSFLDPPQPETLALLRLCRSYPPALMYSIHQPFNLINYNGPAERIALDVQRINGMRIVPDIGYATSGSLGEYFGNLKKVPVITLELPYTKRGQSWEDLLHRNAEAIIYSALNWARHIK
jgi:protein MpaA